VANSILFCSLSSLEISTTFSSSKQFAGPEILLILRPCGDRRWCVSGVGDMAQDDETIAIYSHGNFSAEMAAKIFFSDHTEAEVNHKLHELANLQVSYELRSGSFTQIIVRDKLN
jgi:ATP-dependent protease HslVU (ClpYQ) peptidase subunit